MIDRRLRRQLDRAARRLNTVRTLRNASAVWMSLAVVAVFCWWACRAIGWAVPLPGVLLWTGISLTILLALSVMVVAPYFTRPNYRRVARRIESVFPELQTCLLASLEFEQARLTGPRSYLQEKVVSQALSHGYRHGWHQVTPVWHMILWHVGHLVTVAMFLGALVFAATIPAGTGPFLSSRLAGASLPDASRFDVTVEPGDTEVERGSSLLVLARFRGSVPRKVALKYQFDDLAVKAEQKNAGTGTPSSEVVNRTAESVDMTRALDDPLFGGSVSAVTGSLTYHVEFGSQRSEAFRVGVFEFPRLVRADAILRFPNYTSLEEKKVQDVRRVSAVVGTKVQLLCQLNKSVSIAELIEKDGQSIPLSCTDETSFVYAAEFLLDRSMRFELKLVDEKGRLDKSPAEFVFTALPNNPPDLKLAAPARDVEVSPLEELDLKANAFDDYGLERVGVTYAIAGQQEKELVLASRVPGKQRIEVNEQVALEELVAKPDQLLSYYFWAEDIGPEGSIRQVSSDMYFAEVRPFEEIFRQGQQPGAGAAMQGSANAAQAENLAQLQKEIINATWKLIRREIQDRPTEAFGSDTGLLHQSQDAVRGRVIELAQEIEDPQSRRHIEEVLSYVEAALTHLASARDGPETESLRPALDEEQAAYQSLLKLRAREHRVVMGQQRGAGAGGGASRSQQQLDQLDLKDREDRYETERTAAQTEDPAEREMRQIHSRLRELAQRQNDLNDRLKELQAALQEAKTDREREEVRQQLKRLQEEQERILRDTEELQSRMDQPQNAERMNDARQQIDRARENVRQSSESLREGQVPQAISTGSRASEEFEQLRDEFRKQTSSHFQQAVRDLLNEATRIDEKEKELATEMQKLTEPSERPTSLRESGNRERIASDLQQQQKDLEEMLNRMRQTVEEAEQPQPLLAEKLYDAAREAMQQDLGRGLELTRRLLERGFDEQSRQQEGPVGKGISELREGISRAADSVLESEAETLRRAQRELRELNRQLQQELRDQMPGGSAEGDMQDRAADDERSRAPQEGQPPASERTARQGGSARPGTSPEQPAVPEQDTERQPSASAAERPSSSAGHSDSESSRPADGSSDGRQGSEKPAPESDQAQSRSSEGSPAKGSPGGSPRSSEGSSPSGEPNQKSSRTGSPDAPGSFERLSGISGGGGNERGINPISGEGFRQWSDRLRDVEEVLVDPELSAEAARIRERARAIRAESKRHSAPPNWDLVRMQVAEPLGELLDQVSLDLLRKSAQDVLVPIDRDPVPPEYAEEVRQYFERLGAGK